MKTFVTALIGAITGIASLIGGGICLVVFGVIQINGPQIAIQTGPGDKKIEQKYEPKQEVSPPPQVSQSGTQASAQPQATPVVALNPTPSPAPVSTQIPASSNREQVTNYRQARREAVVEEEEEDYEYYEFIYNPECRLPCVDEIIEYEGRHFQVVSRRGRTITAVEVEIN